MVNLNNNGILKDDCQKTRHGILFDVVSVAYITNEMR